MEVEFEDAITHPPRSGRGPARRGRLRPAALVDLSEWGCAHTERRQVLRARAVHRLARGRVVFSHITAAAQWDLPLIGVSDARVHTTSAAPHPPKTRGDVIRHAVALPGEDIVERNGLLVTTLDRTVADLIRMLPPAAALAAYDAALRRVAWDADGHVIRVGDDSEFRAAVRRRIVDAAGGRGVRNARLVLELGDGRAQLPGESLSRFRMWELNLPLPQLQCRIATKVGIVYLDFAWPALRRFGEFDGEVKLSDPRYSHGRTAEQIVAWQAQRRLAIEEATGWSGMHWGWGPAQDASHLWRVMVEQGFPSRARLGG